MIPGSNLLNTALSVIARQSFQYFAFAARSTNDIGLDVTIYNEPVNVTGSVQAVPRTMYEKMGLDFQKYYSNFFLQSSIIDIARDVSGDQFVFQGKTFNCLSKTDWYGIDGWVQVLAVKVIPPGESC